MHVLQIVALHSLKEYFFTARFYIFSFADYLTSPDTLISICLGVIVRMIQNPLKKKIKEQLQGDLKNT